MENVKQLALAYKVYPDANHTRAQHSLGVCHLAFEFCISIQNKAKQMHFQAR